MAPKIKRGLEFFRRDTSLTDRERYVIQKCGPAGFAAWELLKIELYRCGTCLAFGEVEKSAFCSQYQFGEDQLNQIVSELFKAGLLDRGVFDRSGLLTSRDLQLQYITACQAARRKQIEIPAEANALLDRDYPGDDSITIINRSNIRVEESRGIHTLSGVNLNNDVIIPNNPEVSKNYEKISIDSLKLPESLDYLKKYFPSEFEADGLYATSGRIPIVKFPSIRLTPVELDEVFEAFENASLPEQFFKKPFELVAARLKSAKNTHNINIQSWLIGWALRDAMDEAARALRLGREQEYLGRARQ